MKKLLLTLPLLVIPLTAMAQNKPDQMPNTTIEAAKKRFMPILCKQGPKAVADAVYDCYQKTSKNSPEYDQCVIGDAFVSSSIANYNKRAANLGDSPVDIPFFSQENFDDRMALYTASPKFDHYTMDEAIAYLIKSTNILIHAGHAIAQAKEQNKPCPN